MARTTIAHLDDVVRAATEADLGSTVRQLLLRPATRPRLLAELMRTIFEQLTYAMHMHAVFCLSDRSPLLGVVKRRRTICWAEFICTRSCWPPWSRPSVEYLQHRRTRRFATL